MSPELEQLIVALDLKPHPGGGFFRETYRAPGNGSTAIYFALPANEISAYHVLRGRDALPTALGSDRAATRA